MLYGVELSLFICSLKQIQTTLQRDLEIVLRHLLSLSYHFQKKFMQMFVNDYG